MTKRSICYGVSVAIVTLLIVGLSLAQSTSAPQKKPSAREAVSGAVTGRRQHSPTIQTVNAKNSAHATESMSTQSQTDGAQGTNSRFYCGDPDRPMEFKQDFGQVQASKKPVAASSSQSGQASGGTQAHTNPLYQENGKSGTNPLYESGKLTDVKASPSPSGTEDITTRKAGVKQDMSPDHIAKKHIAGVKYEDRTAAGGNSSSSQGATGAAKQ